MKDRKTTLLLLLLLLSLTGTAQEKLLPRATPAEMGMDAATLARCDSAITVSIADSLLPGGVLAVVRDGKMVYLKAYGHRSLTPTVEPMTVETLFDMASVTKPMATGISIMQLLEEGRITLRDRVADYLPDWDPKDPIRIGHLLTHTSGLPPYASVPEVLKRGEETPRRGLEKHIAEVKRLYAPDEGRVTYSCLNFITLQYILEQVTGETLKDYVTGHIYRPMGLRHTGFLPTGKNLKNCAPTELQPDGLPLRGAVHDPMARELNGGISGNAGLFSTAEEMAALCTMLMDGGLWHGKRILMPNTVRVFTTLHPAFPNESGRTPGFGSFPNIWAMGDLLHEGTFGHTGYTGTYVSIDPETRVAIIWLANRVHPHDNTSTTRLNEVISNIVASSVLK